MIARRVTGRRDGGGARGGAITQLEAGSSAGKREISGESLDATCRGLGSSFSQGGGGLAGHCSGHQLNVFSGRDVNSVGSGRRVAGGASHGAHSDATLESDQ